MQNDHYEDYFPRSEMQNCLAEAMMAIPQGVDLVGEGRWELRVEAPYFCKSTDAFAGSYLVRWEQFNSLEEAESEATEYYDQDLWVQVNDLTPPAVERAPVEDDGIPF